MKKSVIVLFSMFLVLGSCMKTEKTTENSNQKKENPIEDSITVSESSKEVSMPDNPESNTGNSYQDPDQPEIPTGSTDGVITTEKYIYSDYPSDNLPMEKLKRTITNENQVVYIKIQNAKSGELYNVKVEHMNPEGNIAIRNIYGPELQDGPFGNEVNYRIPKDGNYTFGIKKNNRAEGSQKGEILITLIKE